MEYRRLGGEGGWPETFDDAAAAVDHVPALVAAAVRPVQAAADLPVVLLGHSAGGHLALWASGRHRLPATSRWHRSHPPPVHGVVALAPVADLAMAYELGLDDDVVAELLGGSGAQLAGRIAELDPTRLPPTAPVQIVHGDEDRHVPLALAESYGRAARAVGADVALDVVEGTEHFALIQPESAAWPRVLAALEQVVAAARR